MEPDDCRHDFGLGALLRGVAEVSRRTLMIAAGKLGAVFGGAALLSACGGGGGNDASPTVVAKPATTFSGTAATGAAMAGATVSINCASGTGTATTAANGSYTKDITDVTLPCVLKATSSDGKTVLHSITTPSTGASANSAQVANITPLTQLLVASLAGTDPAGAARGAATAAETRDSG